MPGVTWLTTDIVTRVLQAGPWRPCHATAMHKSKLCPRDSVIVKRARSVSQPCSGRAVKTQDGVQPESPTSHLNTDYCPDVCRGCRYPNSGLAHPKSQSFMSLTGRLSNGEDLAARSQPGLGELVGRTFCGGLDGGVLQLSVSLAAVGRSLMLVRSCRSIRGRAEVDASILGFSNRPRRPPSCSTHGRQPTGSRIAALTVAICTCRRGQVRSIDRHLDTVSDRSAYHTDMTGCVNPLRSMMIAERYGLSFVERAMENLTRKKAPVANTLSLVPLKICRKR